MDAIVVLSPAMLLGDTCFRVHRTSGGCGRRPGPLGFPEGTAHMPPQRLQKVRVDVDMNLEELLVIM